MADQWDIVEFPAIMPSGEPLWLNFGKGRASQGQSTVRGQMECAVATKSYVRKAAMVKRDWWQEWEEEDIPDLDYITVLRHRVFKERTADFLITTWGVFPYTKILRAPNS